MNISISNIGRNVITSRKLLISILFGLFGLFFSPYGITINWDNISIDLPWSIIFPLLASLAFGYRFGIVAGLSGGALFPFLLWPDDGWSNLTTALCYTSFFAILGLINEPSIEKKIKSKNLRIFSALAVCVFIFGIYIRFIFNIMLSFNPPFWVNQTINALDLDILLGFFFKDSINLIAFVFIAQTLLKLPVVCKLLRLPVYPNMKANSQIFIFTIAISICVWLVYVGLGKSLLRGVNILQPEHISLALLVIITSGFIVAQILLRYSENQFSIQIQLNTSEENFRKSIEFTPVPISVAKHNGEIVFINKQFIKSYGYTTHDLPTIENWFILAYPDEEYRNQVKEEWNKLMEFAIQNDAPTPEREFFATCKNGEIKTIEISCYFEKELAICSFQDITERKKAEQELIKAKEKAEDNEKILLTKNDEYEALNEELKQTNEELNFAKEKAEESDSLKTAFLLNMSHEVRTPMNSINGFSQMINNPDLSVEKRQRFTSYIIDSSRQLQSIVDDILTISALETKQERITSEPTNINHIISNLHDIFKTQAQNQQISFFAKQQLTDKQAEIFTDKTKLIQILSNLIGNAIKFTHKGFVEFGYTIVSDSPVETHGRESLQSIQFYVKDTGIGIKSEMQSQIFERFVQVETGMTRKYGGNGLGLSISKGFVELLDGKIWVESEFENGSTFYFTIPYNSCLEMDNTTSVTTQNTGFKTILIAEDEEYNYFLIEELLKEPDVHLIRAKDGKETVEICKSNPNIDLILMDIKMPLLDGNTAAKQIKEFRPDVIIIAQSAYTLEQYKYKYRENVFDDYVAKPINGNELKQKVMKYFDK